MSPLFAALLTLALAGPDTAVVPMKEIVVSATKTPRSTANIANAATVVSGAELRRRGTQTLADALQDIVGLDTGNGSDNGSRLPNIGMWGLKEFDALLITLDGVPVGGPFNPSLSQIPIDDIERIEVVKGPQGTLYGVSAFAGMISVFSRESEDGRYHATGGGGSFSDVHGNAGVNRSFENGVTARLAGSGLHSDGWQERTGSEIARGSLNLSKAMGSGKVNVGAFGYRDKQKWGTPLPFEGGVRVEEFDVDKNYAVGDAEIEHKVFGLITQVTYPLTEAIKLENTLSFTRDDQPSLRSFLGEVTADSVLSEGVQLDPKENTVYEDAHVVSNFEAGGRHELVGGAAVTWGSTKASGIGFDFSQSLSGYPDVRSLDQIPVGDHRSFDDRRTFAGVYLHDDWTPVERVTIGGGGRFDNVTEKLEAADQEVGGPVTPPVSDSKTSHKISGDAALLLRLAPPEGWLDAANAYVNYKSSFKPAAPNLTEAEDAKILEPEWTHSIEGGLKTRVLGQFALDLSVFQMDFQNMVVAIDVGGTPGLTNAGRERFKGYEADARWSPRALPGASLLLGYAHHDARFIEFVSDEGGTLSDVSGNYLEQVPKEMFNAKAEYAPERGLGGFVAARYRGERFFARDNAEILDAYTEWDAGATFKWGPATLIVTGRNLGDDRHVVTESEIGPDQVYLAPPRRFSGEVTYQF